jgi:cell division protein FtsW
MVREVNILLVAVSVLAAFGGLMVYSASSLNPTLEGVGLRNLVYIAIGFAAMYCALRFDYRRFKDPMVFRLLVLGALALLVIVLIPGVGTKVDGGQRWLRIMGFGFQPSEVAKFALIVLLAVKLTDNAQHIRSFLRGYFPPLIIAGVFVALVLLERDLGVPVVMCSTAFVMLFVAGARWQHLVMTLAPAVALASVAVAVAPHRMARMLAFVDPYGHRETAGWHLIQSFSAFAQGGVLGRGPGAGEQRLGYLPAAHTDFIFAVIGEEFGLLGTFATVAVFSLLLFMAFRIAANAQDRFGGLVATGIAFTIGVQAVFIMGVTTGLLPTKGLPLPFVSYGGTALIVMMGMAGVLGNIGMQAPALDARPRLIPAGTQVAAA